LVTWSRELHGVTYLRTHSPVDGDLRAERAHDGRETVQRAQPLLDAHEVLLGHQVGLVEQHAVGKRYLLDSLVFGALSLLLVEVLLDVFGVDLVTVRVQG